LGLALPFGPHRAAAGGINALGVGPGRWLILHDGANADFESRLARQAAGLGALCLQSDAYVVLRVAGARARAALAKGVPIDLHPQAFALTDAAVTLAGHVGVIVWRIDDTPTYDLAFYRSYEQSVSSWLRDSAAEYGLLDETGSADDVR
jgi:sarcosine oxidase subunit gamma